MSGSIRMRTDAGVSWHWSFFVLGLAYAVPAVVVTVFHPIIGLGLAIGVMPAAAYNLPRFRRGRRIILVIGALSAASLLVGSLLTQIPALAVTGVFALAVGFALWGRRSRAGVVALVLCLPLVGIALSLTDLEVALVVSGVVLLGTVYAWAVARLWPDHQVTVPVRDDVPTRGEMLLYGVLLGCAGASAAAVGYLWEVVHVGWAAGAALMVMRPVRGHVVRRTVSRAASVLAGAFAAAGFAALQPQAWATAIAVGVVLAALSATQASRWYIAPAFTSFIALTLVLQAPGQLPGQRLAERLLLTLVGVAAALLFGAAVPAVIRRFRPPDHPPKGVTP